MWRCQVGARDLQRPKVAHAHSVANAAWLTRTLFKHDRLHLRHLSRRHGDAGERESLSALHESTLCHALAECCLKQRRTHLSVSSLDGLGDGGAGGSARLSKRAYSRDDLVEHGLGHTKSRYLQ